MTRAALHQLVDDLPESELDQLAALYEAARTHDRALLQSLLADEEPPAPGDMDALAEMDRSDTIPGEEIERRYGML